MRARWLLIVFGPALLLLVGGLLASVYLPYPVPKTATPAQRTYLTHCASCHGADGQGSWRATLFLLDTGNLAGMAPHTDEYLLNLVKHGGATLGKPGMPAFGFHLSDDQIRDLTAYLRQMGQRPAR